MPTNVKILDHRAAEIVLLEAMVKLTGDDGDIMKIFNMPADGELTEVSVQVLVNGVEVDYIVALREAIDRMMETYKEDVHRKAVELISRSPKLMDARERLNDAIESLDDAEWKIRQALDIV